jgi:2-polyprenyl-3-methyl-5-hydroxy-6-metoxy-1,4-benzoquinol methylase
MDVILLLDVLEHVADDADLLRKSLKSLKKGGVILITVPAHPLLFSEHDRALHHYRRYTHQGLMKLLHGEKLLIDEDFSFYGTLLTFRLIQKALEVVWRPKTEAYGVGHWPFPKTHLITRGIEIVLNWDFAISRTLSKIGLPIPGLSLCVRCRKPSV